VKDVEKKEGVPVVERKLEKFMDDGCIFNAEAYGVSEFLGVLSGAAAKV